MIVSVDRAFKGSKAKASVVVRDEEEKLILAMEVNLKGITEAG